MKNSKDLYKLGTNKKRRKLKGIKNMTICIATISESPQEPKIVFCADRLVTDANGLTFEQAKPKIDVISENCLVMSAGKGAESDQIIRNVQERVIKEYQEGELPNIKDVTILFSEECQKLRVTSIENELLKSRGLTLKEFYLNIKSFPDWLGIMLDSNINDFDFGVNFLVFGFSIQEKKYYTAELYKIEENGQYHLLNSIGFGIIGIGDIMSLPEITRETYNPSNSLSDALVRSYWAKKSAERVVSVGSKTTDLGFMWVELSKDNSLVVKNTLVGNEFLEELKKSFELQSQKIQDTTNEIQHNVDDIIKGKKTQSLESK